MYKLKQDKCHIELPKPHQSTARVYEDSVSTSGAKNYKIKFEIIK